MLHIHLSNSVKKTVLPCFLSYDDIHISCLIGILCEYSRFNKNKDVGMPINVCLGVRKIYFFPLYISSYHFDNVNMLIFVSNNIIIGSHRFVLGLLSYPM